MTNLHIYAPAATAATAKTIDKETCLDCKKKTSLLSFFTPWHGWDSTCIKCGRNWIDGEWMPLPFERQSRQKSIAAAKQRWRKMPPMSENYYDVDE